MVQLSTRKAPIPDANLATRVHVYRIDLQRRLVRGSLWPARIVLESGPTRSRSLPTFRSVRRL